MSMTDSIADMLTRIRNAQAVHKSSVIMRETKIKSAIAKVLKDEGYIVDYKIDKINDKRQLLIFLKYYQNKPVIESIRRVSKPSLRIYRNKTKLPLVLGGMGIAVVSTSRGVMSDRSARLLGEGGEILCYVN
ncbi:MAG: 30S ribosomal protein S8 [Coxiellaceae bacterium]|nr:30S ribosomal protein S8 [Coxiellaceae bacterium]